MKRQIARRTLGKTGLEVTEVSFGAMNLRRVNSPSETVAVVDYVLDQGVNLIDTARAYNGDLPGGEFIESEVIVGNTIRSRRDLTEPIVIVTKGHVYTPEDFERELAISLQKLDVLGRHELFIGATPIKLAYMFHGINTERWQTMKESGVFRNAARAKEEGRIHFLGFSSHFKDTLVINEAIESGMFDLCELPNNIFNNGLSQQIELAYRKGMGVINMKAFSGNEMASIFGMLKEYLEFDYRTMLQFCLSNPYISTVDVGAKYPAEFKLDLETTTLPLPDSQIMQEYYLKAQKLATNLNMKELCRDCRHCQEKFACAQGIDFPTVLLLLSRSRLAKLYGKPDTDYRTQYRNLKIKADACLECGLCEPWCEYDIKIRDLLKQAHQELVSK